MGDIIGKSGDLFGKRQEKDSLGRSTSQYRQSFFKAIEKLGLSNAVYGYLPFTPKISRSKRITSKPLPNESLQRSTTSVQKSQGLNLKIPTDGKWELTQAQKEEKMELEADDSGRQRIELMPIDFAINTCEVIYKKPFNKAYLTG